MSKLSFKISDYQSTLSGLDAIENVDSDLLSSIIDSNLVKDPAEMTILKKIKKSVLRNRLNTTYKQADYNFGRNFALKSISLGCMRKPIRHTLMKAGGYKDIDMINCHATILQQLCKSNDKACPQLDNYINNRDSLLEDVKKLYGVDRDQAKKLFIILLFYGTFNTWRADEGLDDGIEASDYITKLTNELKGINDTIIVANPKEFETCKKLKKKHPKGSVVSLLLQSIEDHILSIIYNKLERPKNVILSFDGLAILTDEFPDIDLRAIEDEIRDKTRFDMQLLVKELSYAVDETALTPEVSKYKYTEFEKTNFKILNSGMYCTITADDKYIFRTKKQMEDAYEHLPNEFIFKWIGAKPYGGNPLIRKYDDVDIYPPPLVCPSNKFNLWKPFAMEAVTEYTHNEEALQALLKHILILCDNDQVTANWLTNWMGQMIQYPAIKTKTPVIISKQGAGKGTLMKIISKMIGDDKYFETANPSRDVWGNFNAMLSNCYFVNLNELGKKDVIDAESRLKALQTDERLTINEKGKSQFDIKSYHRFMITTNNFDPLRVGQDDRRNIIIRASDELIGNKEYFTKWNNEYLNDVNCIKTFYEYFKALPGLDNFYHMEEPNTEHQQDLKQLSISKPEMWLKHYIQITMGGAPRDTPRKMTSNDIFNEFNMWKENQRIQYETTALKLIIAIKNLRIDGVSTKKEKQGNVTLFDYAKLIAYFDLDE
jgi:hypothetical protein